MELTKEQQRVVDAGGDLLVTASAGCGKTTVMLERVLRLLKGGTPLSRMLISTYTNSAAADMRCKLNVLLRAEYERTGERFIKEQYEYLPSADISTLHTWCLKTIRKYFFVTGDDPAFEVAGAAESIVWKREAVQRAVDEASQLPENFELFETYTSRRKTFQILSIVSDLMEFAAAQDDGDGWLAGAAAHYGGAEVNAFLAEHEIKQIKNLERRFYEFEMSAKSAGVWDKAQTYLEALRLHAGGGDEPYPVARGITVIKDEYDALKKSVQKLEQFREDRASFRNDEAAAAAEMFVKIAQSAAAYYAARKEEKGQLDFNDLERRAKDILLSSYGGEVRASYSYIFIDEYQDINPLQESIIKLLKGDNTMFFVGDIKQSIYSFRNCSPRAFAQKSRELPVGAVLPLNSNFRCRSGILGFCNNVFSRVMTEEFGMVDYHGGAMFDVSGSTDDGSVEIITLPEVEKEKKEAVTFDSVYSVRAAAERVGERTYSPESVAVASKVIELLGGSITENGVTRAVNYDDIVVIVRSRGGCVSDLEHVLRAAGVPVSLSRDLKLSESRYSRDLMSYMRLIDNRRDDIACLASMRSCFGGFTDAELAEVRRNRREGGFYAAVERAAEGGGETAAKINGFLDTLGSFTDLSRITDVGGLAGKITAHFDYFKYVLGKKDGGLHADAISGLLDKMNHFDGTLSEWLEYMDTVDPTADPPPSGGSVRIMTTHGSKGLEFPFVVLCNLGQKFSTKDLKDGMCDSGFGLALMSRNRGLRRKFCTDVLTAAKIKKEYANKEEELRILYVAMTRAKYKLVLILPDCDGGDTEPASAGCASDWLVPHAKAWGSRGHVPLPEVKPPLKVTTLNEKTLQAIEGAAVQLELPENYVIKSTVTKLIRYDGEGEPRAREMFPETGSASSIEAGNAYHRALELYDYAAPESQLDGLLADIEGAHLIDKEKLLFAVRHFAKKINGKKLYREQPFLFSQGGMIVQGVIDMLIVGGGSCEIVDYKTGSPDNRKMDEYRRQLALYADAVERVLNLKVKGAVVYSVDGCAEYE